MPQLEIPTCASCGARVFSNDVDDEISRALRSHLRLLAPEQILAAIKELGMSQKGVAECLGIAEATLSRWVNGLLIQSRAMDNLLRAYFASSRVREMLLGTKQDPDLGTRLSYDSVKHETADRDEPDLRRLGLRNAEAIFPEVERVYGLDAVNEYGRSVARRGQLLPVGR
jgi:transcriptional regulator with XRE-family HTH domain